MTAHADPTPEPAVEETPETESDSTVEQPTDSPSSEESVAETETEGVVADPDDDERVTEDPSVPDEVTEPETADIDEAPAEDGTEANAAAAAAPAEEAVPAEKPAPAEESAPAEEAVAVPTPAPAPAPTPARMPSRPAKAAPKPTATAPKGEPWGRVDDDGTVSVREADDSWRVVGQYPDGSPEEALAYFERKYADLAGEVGLLEVRHRRGGASASDLRGAVRTVQAKLSGAAAVGDLASLEARVAALTGAVAAASETEAAAAREAVDAAVVERTGIVEKAEAIAARDPKSVQWKQASADMTSLFDQWQSLQQTGPRLPKNTAQALWKRFRDARATVDKHRREFYAELDEANKLVRDRKTKLIERAEALAPRGEDGIGSYRELLDQWKASGRAGKKLDDSLWARFKAAGDALYGARSERETADAESSREKIVEKRALLEEAAPIADEKDLAKARTQLTNIQRRWDEIGRIFPRDAERTLDDELRRIEQGVRTREESDWKRNNPETKARANDMTRQLTDAIDKLESELEAAKKSGDKKAISEATDALEARRGWLRALGG